MGDEDNAADLSDPGRSGKTSDSECYLKATA
jgi:hypothetical protein